MMVVRVAINFSLLLYPLTVKAIGTLSKMLFPLDSIS
jgi:hypothetical protein